MDAIHGFTIQLLAAARSKQSELATKYGDLASRAHFEAYLASIGQSGHSFASAHCAWVERFKADRSGKLAAQFHEIEGALARKAHYGDVEDMSQEAHEGVTLETYAKVSAGLAEGRGEAVIQEAGLDMAQWQRASEAWNAAMAQDAMHKITMQYGMLYQKYAAPPSAEQQAEQNAALAASYRGDDIEEEEEEEEELTQAQLLEQLKSKKREERRQAAYYLANMYDEDEDETHACLACVPHLIDTLENHGDDGAGDAEGAARQLVNLRQRNDNLRQDFEICLGRAREKLQTLEAAFAPIQDKAVPERVYLQAKIQDYTSLVEALRDHLDEWENDGQADADTMEAEPIASVGETAMPSADPPGNAAKKAGGLFGKLKKNLFGGA